MKLSYTKRLVMAAACIALCVVLPMAFHSFPNGGSVFLPMHIPVLLCGLMCSWPYGLIVGLLGPALSSLITSMPPAAMLPSMMVECAVYGAVAGGAMCLIRTKRAWLDLYAGHRAFRLGDHLSGYGNPRDLHPAGADPHPHRSPDPCQAAPQTVRTGAITGKRASNRGSYRIGPAPAVLRS